MAAHIQMDPDAVLALSRLARSIAADLDVEAPPGPPGAPDPAGPLTAPVRRAAAELVAFAEIAEPAVGRALDADRTAAAAFSDPSRLRPGLGLR